MQGRIIQSLSGYYDMLADGKIYRTRARGNFRKRKIAPVVGDFGEFEDGYLLALDERKNKLVRPPVANVDVAIVVTAWVQPKFSSNLLDRQLVMLAANDIQPWLYFSKVDLATEEERQQLAQVASYYAKYYPVFLNTDENVAATLTAKLSDQVAVVMGQTGAGKSTLLNELDPHLALATGEVSKALKRGKHTTRKVTLHQIGAGLIADTPGFSSFDLLDLTKNDLPQLFVDFHEWQNQCKFRGCLHMNEPQCAVKAAVEAGSILKSRYDNYCQMQAVLSQQKPRYR